MGLGYKWSDADETAAARGKSHPRQHDANMSLHVVWYWAVSERDLDAELDEERRDENKTR